MPGALASSTDTGSHHHHQRQQQQQQQQQQQRRRHVSGPVVEQRQRRRDAGAGAVDARGLRGRAVGSSSSTAAGLSLSSASVSPPAHASAAAAEATAEDAGAGQQDGETMDGSALRAALRGTGTKQGSRRPRNDEDDEVPEHGRTAERVAVVGACIGVAVLFMLGWCWLSSMVVCVSWCVCKCARRGPHGRSSESSGEYDLKHVESYANAVRATFCGTLASVVCASGEDATPDSRTCTPQPGVIRSGNGNRGGRSDGSADADRAAGGGGDDDEEGAGLAIFRLSLTATAVGPVTPAVTPSAQDRTCVMGSQSPAQQQHPADGNGSGISPAFCSTAEGGGDQVTESLFWEEEEKRSENGSTAATVAPQRRTGGPGVLWWGLFGAGGSRGGRGDGGARGRRDLDPATPATPDRTSWGGRLWARVRSGGGGTGGGDNPGSPPGATAAGLEAAGVLSVDRSLERSSERSAGEGLPGAERSNTAAAAAAGSREDRRAVRGVVETMSHRRRAAHNRVAGGGAALGERGSTGSSSGSSSGSEHLDPQVTADIAPVSGCGRIGCSGAGAGDGAGASAGGVAGAGTGDGGGRDDLTAAEPPSQPKAGENTSSTIDATAAEYTATEGNSSNSSSGGGFGSDDERGTGGDGPGVEATSIVSGPSGSSPPEEELFLGGGNTEPATACTDVPPSGAAAAAAQANPSAKEVRDEHGHVSGTESTESRDGLVPPLAEVQVRRAEEGEGGDESNSSPVLPRARVLWRAFSEVDHEMIKESHRLAGLRHQARFAPAPGVENPPMCYVPFEG